MRFCIALAVLFAAVAVSWADDTPQDAKFEKVVVIDEFEGDLQEVAKLPATVRHVARDLVAGLQEPSFTYENGTLTVGYDEPALAKGVRLAEIAPRSDCSNNTQFNVTNILVQAEKRIEAAVTTWTRHRHDAPEAPLKVINKGKPAADLVRNFDVQLRLNRVASLR